MCGFFLSLSEWSVTMLPMTIVPVFIGLFTICPMPYDQKLNVLSASLKKYFSCCSS